MTNAQGRVHAFAWGAGAMVLAAYDAVHRREGISGASPIACITGPEFPI